MSDERGNLVLLLRKGEGCTIGDDIEVRINPISRGQIRVLITAPKDLNIGRLGAKNIGECYEIPRTTSSKKD